MLFESDVLIWVELCPDMKYGFNPFHVYLISNKVTIWTIYAQVKLAVFTLCFTNVLVINNSSNKFWG